jgi:hypothetical protein
MLLLILLSNMQFNSAAGVAAVDGVAGGKLHRVALYSYY